MFIMYIKMFEYSLVRVRPIFTCFMSLFSATSFSKELSIIVSLWELVLTVTRPCNDWEINSSSERQVRISVFFVLETP